MSFEAKHKELVRSHFGSSHFGSSGHRAQVVLFCFTSTTAFAFFPQCTAAVVPGCALPFFMTRLFHCLSLTSPLNKIDPFASPGYVAGGTSGRRGRQTFFFTAVDPMKELRKTPPRFALYKKWVRNLVFC